MKQNDLLRVIENGIYCLLDVSTDAIPNNMENYQVLIRLLHGYTVYPVIGQYKGITSATALCVIKPKEMEVETFICTMMKFGRQFDQESIIISQSNAIQLFFLHSTMVKTANGYAEFDTNQDYAIINPNTSDELKIGKFYLK
jgi:hypothetical protein